MFFFYSNHYYFISREKVVSILTLIATQYYNDLEYPGAAFSASPMKSFSFSELIEFEKNKSNKNGLLFRSYKVTIDEFLRFSLCKDCWQWMGGGRGGARGNRVLCCRDYEVLVQGQFWGVE